MQSCKRCLVLISIVITAASAGASPKPPGFKFGVATAASATYQVEGGWNADGKGENIWDRYTNKEPGKIKDHSNGNVACDSYHLWETDVDMLENLGVDFYRFSLSWSRILPTGFPNKINQLGVRYYNNLINRLMSKGIEPMVTLYHWDLPQPIQDLGGWTNEKTADYFQDYARVAFTLFGDRVKLWITINEPASICVDVYEYNNGAPDVSSPGIGAYMCGKTVLIAHAQAYHLYDSQFRNAQNGKVGITIDSIWAEPKTDSVEDLHAADREMQMTLGWFAHPIFSKTGDYPSVMRDRVANISALQNFPQSRLPVLSSKEVGLLYRSADFLGLNHYHTWLVTSKSFPLDQLSFSADKGTQLEASPSWPKPQMLPWGLTRLLLWIRDQYNNPLVYITENGIGDATGTANDTYRIQFIQGFVLATFVAVNEGGCNVARYTLWSLMDNMEWTSGYTVKFGLYHVDFQSTAKTRTMKMSGAFFKGLIGKEALN